MSVIVKDRVKNMNLIMSLLTRLKSTFIDVDRTDLGCSFFTFLFLKNFLCRGLSKNANMLSLLELASVAFGFSELGF